MLLLWLANAWQQSQPPAGCSSTMQIMVNTLWLKAAPQGCHAAASAHTHGSSLAAVTGGSDSNNKPCKHQRAAVPIMSPATHIQCILVKRETPQPPSHPHDDLLQCIRLQPRTAMRCMSSSLKATVAWWYCMRDAIF